MPSDKYTYPGTSGVLRNRLGITDAVALDEATNDLVTLAWAEMLTEEVPDVWTPADLCEVHRRLFRDVFDWAGQLRDVEVHAANASVVYAPKAQVVERLAKAFDYLAENNQLCGLDALAFAAKLAQFWTQLTIAHPFRDGNTRSQTFAVHVISELAGHPIAWDRVDYEALRDTRMAAAQGHAEALGFFIENHLATPPW